MKKIVFVIAFALSSIFSFAQGTSPLESSAYPEVKLTNDNSQIVLFGDGQHKWSLGTTGAQGSNFIIYDKVNGGTRLSIDETSGNIGIGTATPATQLDITGGTSSLSVTYSDGARTAGYFATLYSAFAENTGYLAFGGAGGTGKVIGGNKYGAETSIYANDTERIRILSNGNVGIGTERPISKFEVNGDISLARTHKIKFLETVNGNDRAFIRSTNGQNGEDFNSLIFAVNTGIESMIIKSNGDVGIGTTDTQGFKLGVNGKIAATEVKVATYENWKDFVFEKDYDLPTLSDVENHINEKGHLKDIPSAEEVAKDGFFLAEMDSKLLQKIEELTLYMIDQNKKTNLLVQEVEELKKQNELLKKQIIELEKKK